VHASSLGYFELWFGVMGVLLIACARRNMALEVPGRGAGVNRRATWPARFGTGLSLTGIAVVVGRVHL
jgi:hypothetical protein